jgi:hypothetical protein
MAHGLKDPDLYTIGAIVYGWTTGGKKGPPKPVLSDAGAAVQVQVAIANRRATEDTTQRSAGDWSSLVVIVSDEQFFARP